HPGRADALRFVTVQAESSSTAIETRTRCDAVVSFSASADRESNAFVSSSASITYPVNRATGHGLCFESPLVASAMVARPGGLLLTFGRGSEERRPTCIAERLSW